MAIRRTTKLINELVKGFSVRDLLRDGRIAVYSGSQPSDADDAPTGTKLLEFTENGNTFSAATASLVAIAIGGSATGAITSITVGGMGFNLLSEEVAFTTSAAATTALIVDNINAYKNPLNIRAEVSTSNVILFCPDWVGVGGNGLTFATSTTGSLTATSSGTFASGVNAVNGVNFSETVTGGTLSKDSVTWQGTGLSTGTAGWFRFVAGGSTESDAGSGEVRFDGTVGTSNADMIISATTITTDAVYTISTGTIIEPAE